MDAGAPHLATLENTRAAKAWPVAQRARPDQRSCLIIPSAALEANGARLVCAARACSGGAPPRLWPSGWRSGRTPGVGEPAHDSAGEKSARGRLSKLYLVVPFGGRARARVLGGGRLDVREAQRALVHICAEERCHVGHEVLQVGIVEGHATAPVRIIGDHIAVHAGWAPSAGAAQARNLRPSP